MRPTPTIAVFKPAASDRRVPEGLGPEMGLRRLQVLLTGLEPPSVAACRMKPAVHYVLTVMRTGVVNDQLTTNRAPSSASCHQTRPRSRSDFDLRIHPRPTATSNLEINSQDCLRIDAWQ